ncbi:bifunctional phosphoribosylaminoimidazolecarboxamide formyltransferase/IMP cyclohydrolase [Halococcus sp. IIIV-5B]|uniref:bifunctional phosphoribosylaminoimidazolecarboxamide formyltransferase/IMP cyclohydrolase n=1 Tax=Halococcus sp. IIIV-5B TaxID=2321230 RepID=UPI000E72B826|nr:bifunctional phosphoribosylaminoimidazolecarboxamide formyltransferase/IMP cyclohydrolase [Halococcus sp. IIIV-5B]RJT02728.1 bifunctional phosphoribosylaminoimidazolecarboxamide formyltransferase/IMP cyclohydrolase PurH [Halococcus sp. IIIV-5B]
MTRIAGLAGNRGRNLLRIAEREPGGAELAVVLTDDPDAPVLDSAAERGVPTEVVEQGEDSREAHERRLLDALDGYDVDLVCLDGYMRVLTGVYLDDAPPTFNVHPSLLPAFPGADAHEQVLDSGVSVTGCTVHVATEEVDKGPIVTQEAVPVYANDDAESLKTRVLQRAEFAAYPRAVRWFAEGAIEIEGEGDDRRVRVERDATDDFPSRRMATEERGAQLRYGENPHQAAAVYSDPTSEATSVVDADQLNPDAKALSYNNYNDADGALGLIEEFDEPAAAVIKHTNPAGCATADDLATAYERALATDPMSAFGGIVALNRECDAATAEQVIDSYKEVVVAPGYTDDALSTLREKESLRVLDVGEFGAQARFREKPLAGGRLVQERDAQVITPDDLEVVTEREPTDEQLETMCFAWQVIKHVKSNAILLADGTETVGVGMGQVSRVDAVRLAAMKADEHAEGKGPEGSVLASDAFFPFPDGIEAAAAAGVDAVVQPGGSMRDDEVVAAADDLGLAMAHTGQRAFRHD